MLPKAPVASSDVCVCEAGVEKSKVRGRHPSLSNLRERVLPVLYASDNRFLSQADARERPRRGLPQERSGSEAESGKEGRAIDLPRLFPWSGGAEGEMEGSE